MALIRSPHLKSGPLTMKIPLMSGALPSRYKEEFVDISDQLWPLGWWGSSEFSETPLVGGTYFSGGHW